MTSPLMLSELIQVAQKVLVERGDMPVGLDTWTPLCNDPDYIHILPASGVPSVNAPAWLNNYWIGKFKRAFVINSI
jgi:hypothetical protein